MASSQRHISSRMFPGLLSIFVALAAAAEPPPTVPSALACPKINATSACSCRGRQVTCNGLRVPGLAFLAPSVSFIGTLVASHNDIRELTADFLPGATNLTELTLSHNKISSIDRNFFESLPSLVFLDLSYNELTEFYLPQNGLPNLEILNLTNNFLSHLRFDANRPNKKYPPVKLNRNSTCGLNSYNGALFHDGLEQLFLSQNKIGNDLNFLRNLTKLVILTLGFNNISTIPLDVLPCNAELRCLQLNNNRLSDLTFLKCTGFLDQLNVSSNAITTVSENAFTDLSLLRFLEMADNEIENSRFLHGVSSDTIYFLDLSRNKLSNIPSSSMIHKSDLRYIDISFNELTDIKFAGHLTSLKVLLANNNKISEIDSSLFLQRPGNVIETLSLSNNFLSDIAFVKQLHNITSINLRNNKIIDIQDNTMSQMKKLVELDLSNNIIHKVNFVYKVPSLRFLNLSNNDVTQLPCNPFVQSVSLNGNDVRTLQLNCAPNLRYLYIYGGVLRDRKEQQLCISKEVELYINNQTIPFPCFPTREDILKCKQMCSPTVAFDVVCDPQGNIFSSPVAILIYCLFAIVFILVVFLITAKCCRLRRLKHYHNKECLCGKEEGVQMDHPFTRNKLGW